jgi:hypothetical protein
MTNGQNVFNGKSWFCKDRTEDVNDNHCDIFPIHKTNPWHPLLARVFNDSSTIDSVVNFSFR